MIRSWMVGFAAALMATGAVRSQESPRQLQFSASEQQLWQLTMVRHPAALTPAQLLRRLDAVAPPADNPPLQMFWWVQRCRFALLAGDDTAYQAARTALKMQEAHSEPGEFAGSAGGYKCLQISKFSAGESTATRQLGFLAYHSLTAADSPALHAWVSLDYGYDALAAGFVDSAASAVSLALNIARQNQLTGLEADSLALQAEVQLAQAQHAQALTSLSQAAALTSNPAGQRRLQQLRGRVLRAEGRWQEASTLYQALWQQPLPADEQLSAGLALLDTYLQLQDRQHALRLSHQLLQHPGSDRILRAQSRLRHAMALLINGQVPAAIQFFDDAGGWLARTQLAVYLPEQLRFAELLAQQGQYQAAVLALRQSLHYQRQLDAAANTERASLSSTLLIAEQRSRALKLAELQQQLLLSTAAEQHSRQQQQWLSLLCTALGLLLTLLLFRRLYRWRRRQKPR